MKKQSGQWTRRQFSQLLAASAASSVLVRSSAASTGSMQGLAFVGSLGNTPVEGRLQVFRVSGSQWQAVHAMEAASPAHLAIHPALPMLYAVHQVSLWNHLPQGAVSAYRFDERTGMLQHGTTQPLSLSATQPRHALVTADGRSLFVSSEAGGIYNLLPLSSDGMPEAVAAVRKEFGSAVKRSAPGAAVLHPGGIVFAADPGKEVITGFKPQEDTLAVVHRSAVHAGAGASQLALSPCGSKAYAMHAEDGSISLHAVLPDGLSPALQVMRGTGRPGTMLMHPGGRYLVTISSGSLSVFYLEKDTGRMQHASRVNQADSTAPNFSPSGDQMVYLLSSSGEIALRPFDSLRGTFGAAQVVAQAKGAVSLHLHLA